MNRSSNDVDPAAYSTRVCRCGADMRRLTPSSRYAWACPVCGRQHRR